MKKLSPFYNGVELWLPHWKWETIWMYFTTNINLYFWQNCVRYPARQQQPTAAFRKLNLFFMLFYTPGPQTFSSSVRVQRRMRMMKLTWDFHKQIFLSNYHPNSSCWQQIWNENLLTSYDSSKNCFHPNNYCKKVKGVLAEFRLVS